MENINPSSRNFELNAAALLKYMPAEESNLPVSFNPQAQESEMSSSDREMASAILPPRWYAPRQCSKRVWLAPGKTRLAKPSCLTPLSLCISCLLRSSRNGPSTLMLPWTGSCTVFAWVMLSLARFPELVAHVVDALDGLAGLLGLEVGTGAEGLSDGQGHLGPCSPRRW